MHTKYTTRKHVIIPVLLFVLYTLLFFLHAYIVTWLILLFFWITIVQLAIALLRDRLQRAKSAQQRRPHP